MSSTHPELPLHIEASDFDAKWQASATSGRGFVSMRFDFKQVGQVKTTVMGEDKVELCWSSDDGRALNRQIVTLGRLVTGGGGRSCLSCPRCGGPRKRLFLVPVRNLGRRHNRTNSFSFTCKKCGGIDD